jgi:hypothetical protein
LTRLPAIILLAAIGSAALAGDRLDRIKGTSSSSVSFLGWDAGTPIFEKVTTGDLGGEKDEYFRMHEGKRVHVGGKALPTHLESLPQGTVLTIGSPFPLRLVNLDEAKIQPLVDAVLQFQDGKWPEKKPFPSAAVRLAIHFKGKDGKEQILWRGTRTVRVYADGEAGPTAGFAQIRQASISPDGKSAAVVLVVNDSWEPLLLPLQDR